MSNQHDPETGAPAPAHPKVTQAYRAHSTEVPDAELDARILAAAHRAAGRRPQVHPRRWFHWIDAPLATAAVVLISVTVVMLLREQGDPNLQRVLRKDTAREIATPAPVAARPQASRPEAAAEALQDAPGAAPPAEVGKPSPAGPPAVGTDGSKDDFTRAVAPQSAQPEPLPERERRLESDTTPPATVTREQRADEEGRARNLNVPGPVPAAPPAEAKLKQEKMPEAFPAPKTGDMSVREMESAQTSGSAAREQGTLERKKAAQSEPAADAASAGERDAAALAPAQPVPAPAPAAGGAAAPAIGEPQSLSKETEAAQTTLPRTPEQWLEDIRRLVRDGKLADARLELAEFRKTHPSYPLPDDLKDL